MRKDSSIGIESSSQGYAAAFDSTLHKLNSAFSVWDIATVDPVTISFDVALDDFLEENQAEEYDYYPVLSETGEIIGVVDRKVSEGSRRASESMKILDNSLLVSSGAGLVSALKKLDSMGVLLVLHETKITGILTKADAQKLPVRLYAFTIITHLESLMASIILEKSTGSEDWLNLLSKNRRVNVLKKQADLKKEGMDPPLVECCEFCDKRDVVHKLLKLGNKFKSDIEKVRKLRDLIAHAATIIPLHGEFHEFIERLELTLHWIKVLAAHDSKQQVFEKSTHSSFEGNTI